MDHALFSDIDSSTENLTREELVDLFKRLKELAAKYIRSEEALRLDEARLEALLKLNDMAMVAEDDIIAYSLEEAIRLTGSKIGWMGALSPDEKTLAMHCWSKGTQEECGILGRPHALRVNDGGIWVEPILQRKPVIVNDYEGYNRKCIPYGHVPIRRFMGIPVHDGTRIVAVAEVGNKGSDYDASDVRQLSLLMSGVWRIIMRKRAEDALAESKSQAELYVDFMGHDINNMNQVAMGFLELAIEKLGTEGRLEKDDVPLLEKPMETMRNSAKLIDNVKKLQRLRAGILEPMLLDLGQVLSEVVSEARCTKDRHIVIDYTHTPGRLVKANELLKDVFSNIMENSIKHSGSKEPLMIAIRVSATDRGHEVSIEDNGPGIPDARKDEIFDRLSQGRMRALRTGLGLGLVKTLVESFSGSIRVEDRVEGDRSRGCRFVILLPDANQTNVCGLKKS
jgi:two-component system phosphate regulon sensor histidine kinase PhoR